MATAGPGSIVIGGAGGVRSRFNRRPPQPASASRDAEARQMSQAMVASMDTAQTEDAVRLSTEPSRVSCVVEYALAGKPTYRIVPLTELWLRNPCLHPCMSWLMPGRT